MGRIVFTILTLGFSFLSWGQGEACRFQFTQNQVNVNYNGEAIEAFIQLTIHRENNSANSPRCRNAAIFYSRGQASSYQRKVFKDGQSMSYTIENVSPNGTLKDYGDASGPSEFVLVPLERNQTKHVNILFKLPSQAVPNGTGLYHDILNASVYGYNTMQDMVHVLTKNFIVNVQVQSYMALSLVPTGGPFNASSTSQILDFGELENNETLGADLLVTSNNSYRVQVSSGNGGNLKHTNQSAQIPYEFRFNNNVINLSGSSSVQVANHPGASSSSGDRYALKVKVGNPSGKPMGNYVDAITITVSSN